jgi:ribosomal protein L16 Arg81 hydroxylase
MAPAPGFRSMISTLEELVAPLTLGEFRDLLRARKLLFRRSAGENRFAALLDWTTLRAAIEGNVFPPDKLRVTQESKDVPALFYMDKGKINPAKLAALLDRGMSLIAVPLDPYVPALNTLCSDIRAQTGEATVGSAVVTTGNAGALKLHYDRQDIIVLQLEGSKRWRLYGPPVDTPIGAMPAQPLPQGEPYFDEVLRAGDFLFLPGGFWHHCENSSERSIHFTIMMEPPTGYKAMKAFLPHLAEEHLFRLPLTRFTGPAERAAHEVALKERLIEKIGKMSLAELLAETGHLKTSDDPYA